MAPKWVVWLSYILWFFLIYIALMNPHQKTAIRNWINNTFHLITIRGLLSKIAYWIRNNPLKFFRLLIFFGILSAVAPVVIDNTNSSSTSAQSTHGQVSSISNPSAKNTNSQSIPNTKVNTLLDASQQMISQNVPPTNHSDVIPRTTTVTTKAIFVDPDKGLTNTGSIKVLPQTTYDVETSSQVDYLRAFVTDKSLIYIKWFIAIVFAVLGSFLVTLPFSKVEQLKFLGFEYKVLESNNVEKVADEHLTEYRKAEQAKFAAVKTFCTPRISDINRQLWFTCDEDRLVHLGLAIRSFLLLLEEQMTKANSSLTAQLVFFESGIPDPILFKELRRRTVKDVVLKAAKRKREAFWESADKTFIYARPIFLDNARDSEDFLVVVFHSKDIGFSQYDDQLLEAVQTYIESQQVDLLRMNTSSAVAQA